MGEQTKTVHKKSRGRPAGTKYSETIPARLEPATLASLDAWATSHEVSRSEAIRRLVEIGLTVKAQPRQPSSARTAKANEMAAAQLDQLADKSAPAAEQAIRKRRLLKGPEEFRDVRVDRAKKK